MSHEVRVSVILHGSLKKLFAGDLSFTGFSAAEVINGLCKAVPDLKPVPGKRRRLIQIAGFDTHSSLFEPLRPDQKEIHIYPAFCGGKKGGFIQIAIGIVLVAAAIYFSGGLATVMSAGFHFGFAASIAFSLGTSLILGGLLSVISPAPKLTQGDNSVSDPAASQYLGANANTTKIGTRIPILYGKFRAYGQIVSFNVDAKDVAL